MRVGVEPLGRAAASRRAGAPRSPGPSPPAWRPACGAGPARRSDDRSSSSGSATSSGPGRSWRRRCRAPRASAFSGIGTRSRAEQRHRAPGDVADVGQQLHDRQARRALPAAGLPDEPDAFALVDGERDAVDGADVRGTQVEFRAEVRQPRERWPWMAHPRVADRAGASSCRPPLRS